MSAHYPALGIDLPGSPGTAHAVIESMRNAASQLLHSAPRLHNALDFASTWDGAAAASYRAAGADLVPALNSGAQSLGIAGGALETWIGQMADNQRTADQWERDAEQLVEQLATARASFQAAFAAIRPGTSPSIYDPADPSFDAGVQGMTPALNAAHQRWVKIKQQLDDLRCKAELLRQKHDDQGNAAATRIRSARTSAFEPATHPSFLQGVINGVTDFAGTVAQWSATVTAIAAPIPGLDLLDAVTAPLAAGAGAVHLAGEGEQLITGSSGAPSVIEFLLDAVDARGGRTAAGELGAVRRASSESTSLAGAAHAYTSGTHIVTAGSPDLPRADQIARGRAAARRPAVAAAVQAPFQVVGGSSPLVPDGIGVVVNPSAKSVGALVENQARTLGQRHHPSAAPPISSPTPGSLTDAPGECASPPRSGRTDDPFSFRP